MSPWHFATPNPHWRRATKDSPASPSRVSRARSDSNITLREEEATLWAEQTVVALILERPLLRRCLPEENSPQRGKWRCLKRIVAWSFSPTASIPERFQVCCSVKEKGLFPLR